jgi:hypothetical protein
MVKEFIFTGVLNPGDNLVINTEKMSALLNGEDVRHLVQGEYPMIAPGGGLEYSDEETSRKVRVKIQFRDRWS